jgi:hypothetical protein
MSPEVTLDAVRMHARHADGHQMLAEGCSTSVIAAELSLARNTVRRFARAADPEGVTRPRRNRPQARHPRQPRALPAGTMELRHHQCRAAVAGDPRVRLTLVATRGSGLPQRFPPDSVNAHPSALAVQATQGRRSQPATLAEARRSSA